MGISFSEEQFFDVLAAYNEALWPAAVVLWIVSAASAVLLLSAHRPSDRWISALLAAHWGWSALAYHVTFFTQINEAAWLFAALFLVQAILFIRGGVVHNRMAFSPRRNNWAPAGWLLVAYSLIYPAIGAIDHLSVTRAPTFGLPCPSTIFTTGLLLLAVPRSWQLSVIPVLWSAIGGSAATLFGVRADYALPLAGSLLIVFLVQGRVTHPTFDGTAAQEVAWCLGHLRARRERRCGCASPLRRERFLIHERVAGGHRPHFCVDRLFQPATTRAQRGTLRRRREKSEMP